jgi:hypothetical protein
LAAQALRAGRHRPQGNRCCLTRFADCVKHAGSMQYLLSTRTRGCQLCGVFFTGRERGREGAKRGKSKSAPCALLRQGLSKVVDSYVKRFFFGGVFPGTKKPPCKGAARRLFLCDRGISRE